jgi:hypothetical protein
VVRRVRRVQYVVRSVLAEERRGKDDCELKSGLVNPVGEQAGKKILHKTKPVAPGRNCRDVELIRQASNPRPSWGNGRKAANPWSTDGRSVCRTADDFRPNGGVPKDLARFPQAWMDVVSPVAVVRGRNVWWSMSNLIFRMTETDDRYFIFFASNMTTYIDSACLRPLDRDTKTEDDKTENDKTVDDKTASAQQLARDTQPADDHSCAAVVAPLSH